MKSRLSILMVIPVFAALIFLGSTVFGQDGGSGTLTTLGTSFTYQGRLIQDGTPVSGNCDIRVVLFDDASDEASIGSSLDLPDVTVVGGLFTVQLDFGAGAFDGNPRWLELGTRCPAGSGEFSTLTPRQQVTPAPYALFAVNAPWGGILNVPADLADGDDDTLSSLGCSSDQIAKWDGSSWTCSADADSGGGGTQLDAGDGISLNPNPITSGGSISATLGTSIANSELESNAVTSDKIQDGTIDLGDLNFNPVTNPVQGNLVVHGDIGADGTIGAGGGRVTLGGGSSGAGYATLYGPAGDSIAAIGGMSSDANHGGINLREDGENRAFLYVQSSDGAGILALTNGSGNTRIFLDGSDGSINGSVKSFVMDHPADPSKTITYASIEGPEVAAYIRGTAHLVDGEVWVAFPEHFSLVANSSTMTVQVTPLSASSQGLAVVEKATDGLRIKELNGGQGSYDVDYFVQAVRQGFEDFAPVRDKTAVGALSLEGELDEGPTIDE